MDFDLKEMVIIILFLIGLIFCLNYKSSDLVEGFGVRTCPNLLVKKGKQIHLINTKGPPVPGVNPIKFNNLEEYAEYAEWSRKAKLNCPVLYYEQTYDTQNNRGFRMLNGPFEPKAGLPSNIGGQQRQQLLDSNRDDPPYNQNNYAGFDAEDQYIGVETPLDSVQVRGANGSANPMDPKWCGHKCTQKAIDRGDFDGRTRKILNPMDEKLSRNMPRRY